MVTDGVRVAVDIGGTFTDLVSYDAREQVVRFEKSLSTPEALQSAVMTCFEKPRLTFHAWSISSMAPPWPSMQ
jgi:N-methylhydantoinase A/oxoprolinase/acetone carboxylase beta subunit